MPSQQDPKSARCVPDPFLLLGVGSGDETIHPALWREWSGSRDYSGHRGVPEVVNGGKRPEPVRC